MERARKILDLVFKDKSEEKKFWNILTKRLAKSIGFSREINRKLWVKKKLI